MKRLVALIISSVLLLGVFMGGSAIEYASTDLAVNPGTGKADEEIREPGSGIIGDIDIISGGEIPAIGKEPAEEKEDEKIIITNEAVKITGDNVRFYGRRIDTDEYVQAENSNSGIEVRFMGSFLKLGMYSAAFGSNDVLFVQVWVDGARTERIQLLSGDHDYYVASGLEYGEHTVKVLLVTEEKSGANGAVKFKTVKAEAYKLIPLKSAEAQEELVAGILPPVYDDDQLIMDFYGDSITAGYGTIPGYPDGFRTMDQDSSTTYAFRTAEHFNADANYHCRSGWSIYQSYGSLRGVIPRVWKYVGIEDERAWPVESRPADIVVVALGTNDAWTWHQIPTEESVFTSTYVSFLEDMRKSYPDAYFICTHGMMDTSFNSLVEAAAIEFSKTDAIGAAYVEMPNMHGVEAYTGSGGHPSGTFGEYASTFLIDAIENYYYSEWQYKLMCAADELLYLNTDGWYTDLLDIAYATAKDHNATGRNPKRLYYEVQDAIDQLNTFGDNVTAMISRISAIEFSDDYTEEIISCANRAFYGFAVEQTNGWTKDRAEELYRKLDDAVTAVENGADETCFEGIYLPEGLIGAELMIKGPDGSYRSYPSAGDTVTLSIVTTTGPEELTAKTAGDRFRSSKRGKEMDLSKPGTNIVIGGVRMLEYRFEYKAGMEKITVTDGNTVCTREFRKPQSPAGAEYGLVSDYIRESLGEIDTSGKLAEVSAKASATITGIALVGSFSDDAASHLRGIWEKANGMNSVRVDNYPSSGIMACYNAEEIKKGRYDLVAVELSAGETSADAKEMYESFIRTLTEGENAPAVICLGQVASNGAYDDHKAVADYYGIPYIDLNRMMIKAVGKGEYNRLSYKRKNGERAIIMDGVAVEAIALATIGGVNKGIPEHVYPETPLTEVRFTGLQFVGVDDLNITKATNFVIQTNADGEKVLYGETGRGTLKFTLDNYKSVAIVFRDLTEDAAGASIMGKFGGRNKANTLTYSPNVGKQAFLLYSGDVYSGENSVTATFKGPVEIYGFIVAYGPAPESEE